MSKVRNLPEVSELQPSDLMYAVDTSEGPNAGRKVTVATLKTAVIADANEIPYDNNNSTLAATDVQNAIDELDDKVNNHSDRHAPDAVDGLPVAAPVFVTADGNNNVGTANSYSRSDHKHNVSTGTPVTQLPDQANAPGSASSLARSDHQHNIPTDAPTDTLTPASTNSEGTGNAFARNDHEHAIATGLDVDISNIEPDDVASAGVLDKFARADHVHPISAGPGTTLTPDGGNSEGVSNSFSRADHKHDVPTDVATTLTPDGGNSEGVSSSFARADHKHDVPAAAPTITLSPATTNTEGVGAAFARNDHQHAVATAPVEQITTIQPDDAAAAGTQDTFARGDHKHAIAADIPVNTGTANSEGNSTAFARANHVHNTIIANQAATATADDTTASVTDVQIAGMTLTPAAGTYLATFSSSVLNSGNGASRLFVSIYSAGVQVAHSEREIGIGGGANVPVHTNAIVTVDGTQAIRAMWRAVAGTNTAHERSLTLIRLG